MMLKDQTEKDDIVILSLSGRIEKGDVEQAMGRLDMAFALGGKVHLFVEVQGFEGMSAEAWWRDLGQGMKYLSRLKQFGRIAIVSDQSWVRAASRIESALLPFVTYEVYMPDQRDHALAWVKGEAAAPRPAALRILSGASDEIAAFEIDGRITPADIEALHEHLHARVRPGAELKLLNHVKHFAGFDPSILANPQYLSLKLGLLRAVSRYAVVGGPSWLDGFAKLADPLLRMDIRHFSEGEEQAARAWLLA
jgi:hypothetical protein